MQTASSPPTHSSPKERAILFHQQEVEAFLNRCGLSQYYDIFIEEGFDRPESLFEITETDLIQMQVKRGHRRLLQRAILNSKGIPSTVPLNIIPVKEMTGYIPPLNKKLITSKTMQPNETVDISLQSLSGNNSVSPITSSTTSSSTSLSTLNESQKNNNIVHTPHPHEYFPSAGTMTHSSQTGMSSTEEEAVTSDNVHRLWKRKYHRHAKPDTNAPVKPPSAYVMFSNDVRAELKQQNKSFTDLAKIIGDRWKNISPEEKERYETYAQKAREDYSKKIEEYQRTDSYKQYQKYISDFKAENEAAARPVGRPRKRHKRDEDKECGDASDSARTRRASSISSQPDDQIINHRRNLSSSDQRHYPFYLLNEDGNKTLN